MTTSERPADLWRRRRGDRAMRLLGVTVNRYLDIVSRLGYAGASGTPDAPTELVVAGRKIVADDEDVVQLTLRAPAGSELPPWHAGCHLDVHLPSGRRRQYSLCGDPADRYNYVIAVRRIPDGGGGSVEMHDLDVGDRIAVRGPRNGFPFVAQGSMLFVAGGIGITPILSMIRTAEHLGLDWRLLYTGRTRTAMPYVDDLEQRYPEKITVRTDDEHGIPTAAELLADAPAGGAVYCCGPAPMLDAVRTGFEATDAVALHLERFGAPPVVDGRDFTVRSARTGEVFPVAADETALDVLRRHRPDLAYSCRQGFCGTCKVRVIAGTPEHRDTRLTPDERADHMLVCVSRADGPLVLDL